MTKRLEICDVFLSATEADRWVADRVKKALEDAKLNVFPAYDFAREAELFQDTFYDALVGSRAFVALLSRSSLRSSWVIFEIGGAQAREKPIFFLYSDVPASEIPPHLRKYHLRPFAELDEMVAEVKRVTVPLPDSESKTLSKLYAEYGVPFKDLEIEDGHLGELTRKFNQATGADFTPERIIQELFRLRKEGKLPRVRRRKPAAKRAR